jgi:hypothetical protein
MEKVIMMMQGDDWASLSSNISDRVKHGEWTMLYEHLLILHEGSWLHNNKKVCEKVEIYDFK